MDYIVGHLIDVVTNHNYVIMIHINTLVKNNVFAIMIMIVLVIDCSFRRVIGFIALFCIVIIGFVGFFLIVNHAFISVITINLMN